jgi:pheromone shutdown protein TraB
VELKGPQNSKVFLIEALTGCKKSREQVKQLITVIQPHRVVIELDESNRFFLDFNEDEIKVKYKHADISLFKMYKSLRNHKVITFDFKNLVYLTKQFKNGTRKFKH